MKSPYKFIDACHGEIVMLPSEYKNPVTGYPFDYIQLCGDYVVFGLSTATHLETEQGESKTLRELYEDRA